MGIHHAINDKWLFEFLKVVEQTNQLEVTEIEKFSCVVFGKQLLARDEKLLEAV